MESVEASQATDASEAASDPLAGSLTLLQVMQLVGREWPEVFRGDWRHRKSTVGRWWQLMRQREAVLELWQGDRCLRRLVLGEQRLRIGRDPGCEVPAQAEGLSRVHAFIEKERPYDRDWVLEDFNSANGVFWRDRRIRTISLRDGDVVQLGSPLRESPRLLYSHSRSAWEQVIRGFGLSSLIGSAVVVGGLMLFSTVGGGSRVTFIGGPVKIVSADGTRVDEKEGAATALPQLDDYPLHLRQALLASEDARFGWNSGLDIGGTLRSLVKRSGGGSGITQQVARLYYPWVKQGNPDSPWPWVRLAEPELNDRSPTTWETFSRKLRELPVAWQLETKFTKNQILKMYLDRAFLGLGAEGFEQASQLYFRKSVRSLSLPESAYLVGLLPQPNGYNVCNAPLPEALIAERERLEKKYGKKIRPSLDEKTWTPKLRRDLVLGRMRAEGFISEKQYGEAVRAPLQTDLSICKNSSYVSFPFFSNYVLNQELAGRRYSLNISEKEEGGNYYAVATVDPRMQGLAERHVREFVEKEAAQIGVTQAALISVDYRKGNILAYVGGKKYGYAEDKGESSFDRGRAQRQPGSTFKLFTFLAALEAGVTPQSQISCARIFQLEVGCHSGGASMSMSQGFAASENPVALHLASRVGFDQVIAMARRLGISTPLEANPSMVLGGNETMLYEMVKAYSVVANGGQDVDLHGVERIYDLTICGSELALDECPGSGVHSPLVRATRELVKPHLARQMDAMLQQVVLNGTGRNASSVADARGKTGTTNNGRDVWFIGYSPRLGILTGIWMGNDDNRPAESATSALAARLWANYMNAIS